MKTSDYTASSTETWLLSRKILSESGLEAGLTLIGPGVETPASDQPATQNLILFVCEGSLTATVGLSNFILRKDEALHIATGKTHSVRNHTTAPSKLLTLTLPRPRTPAPALVEFP
ncbi:cupin domain-containing protein [Rariglobus hedericola]|uniref:Cupin domain-containing protein n=1 Tax=Rariglobus hedericola TaxID=2597822 RepID=A0A556QNP1_9BACT|nr:cupin domain-containing protein [Rariglobus hedericola]TSJ78253.1 cupin domain-containing protein [Rariglobus hedericola]